MKTSIILVIVFSCASVSECRTRRHSRHGHKHAKDLWPRIIVEGSQSESSEKPRRSRGSERGRGIVAYGGGKGYFGSKPKESAIVVYPVVSEPQSSQFSPPPFSKLPQPSLVNTAAYGGGKGYFGSKPKESAVVYPVSNTPYSPHPISKPPQPPPIIFDAYGGGKGYFGSKPKESVVAYPISKPHNTSPQFSPYSQLDSDQDDGQSDGFGSQSTQPYKQPPKPLSFGPTYINKYPSPPLNAQNGVRQPTKVQATLPEEFEMDEGDDEPVA